MADSGAGLRLELKFMKAILALEDGTIYRGAGFGAPATVVGEVCFNTSMTGYQEILTDPSYKGQILVLTYPMVGNYGVASESSLDEHGLPLFFESKKIHIAGLIVASYSADHSHWNSIKSLGKIAKCAPRNGFVVMVQTERLFRLPSLMLRNPRNPLLSPERLFSFLLFSNLPDDLEWYLL